MYQIENKNGICLMYKWNGGKIKQMPITVYIERLMTQANFNLNDYK